MIKEENITYWAVVDTINTQYLKEALQQIGIDNPCRPLFLGSRFEHLLEISPVLVKLSDYLQFQDMLQYNETFAQGAVMFSLDNEVSEAQFFIHLQQLLHIQIHHQQVLLRFYSQNFWHSIGDNLELSDIKTILGPAQSLTWCNTDGQLNRVALPSTSRDRLPRFPYSLSSPLFLSWLSA